MRMVSLFGCVLRYPGSYTTDICGYPRAYATDIRKRRIWKWSKTSMGLSFFWSGHKGARSSIELSIVAT